MRDFFLCSSRPRGSTPFARTYDERADFDVYIGKRRCPRDIACYCANDYNIYPHLSIRVRQHFDGESVAINRIRDIFQLKCLKLFSIFQIKLKYITITILYNQ